MDRSEKDKFFETVDEAKFNVKLCLEMIPAIERLFIENKLNRLEAKFILKFMSDYEMHKETMDFVYNSMKMKSVKLDKRDLSDLFDRFKDDNL